MYQHHIHTQDVHPALMNNESPRYQTVMHNQQGNQNRAGISNSSAATLPQKEQPRVGEGWQQIYRTAQNIAFPDTEAACGVTIGDFLDDLAKGIGCPLEYILVPLLPCIGGLMGTFTTIRVHRGWSEPPIVWALVGAKPGSRRSAVVRQLLAPILHVQSAWLCEEENIAINDNVTIAAQSGKRNMNIGNKERRRGTDGCTSHNEADSFAAHDKDDVAMRKNRGLLEKPLKRRTLYSGNRITLPALTEMLHCNNGHVFSLTENVEQLHELLGLLQPLVPPRLVGIVEDLYEGLPLVALEAGQVTSVVGSNFNHGGFASPEFSVALILKCPSWLSSRLLVSCPQDDDMKGVFGEPKQPCGEVPNIEQVFDFILRQHQKRCAYTYNSEAIQELNAFFENEWLSVFNQLDQNEHEWIIGKCMGQIVRISGILKALENGILTVMAANHSGPLPEWNWTITKADVKCAITLGKYFMEQKFAMTFMVDSGFFSSTCPDGSKNGDDLGIQSHSFSINQSTCDESMSLNGNKNTCSTSKQSASSGHPQSSTILDGLATTSQASSSHSLSELPRTVSGVGSSAIDYSFLPQTITTQQENIDEMKQAVDFIHLSNTQFVAIHGRRIKRLLECYDDGHGVSATCAAQKSITPPVHIPGSNNRHPAWASALFFQKVAELKLGIAEQARHPTNRKVCWRFKRKPVSNLNEKNFQLLQYLRVDMDAYIQIGNTPFNSPSVNIPGLANLDQGDGVSGGSDTGMFVNGSVSPTGSQLPCSNIKEDDLNQQNSSDSTRDGIMMPFIKSEDI